MPRLALNPLPWILDTSFHLDVPSLRAGFSAARSCGYRAVQADIPSDLTPAQYTELLAEFDLEPGPGYFGVEVDLDAHAVIESARAHASTLVELGMTQTFLAGGMTPERIAEPARGAQFDSGRLASLTELMGNVARAMVDEGVIPALHPHVGTWIETEREMRAVLDGVDSNFLSFGPDLGHLAWAQVDIDRALSEYRDRITGAHLKDHDPTAAARAHASSANYWSATGEHRVWMEPGRGSVNFDSALQLLTKAPRLTWYTVEVDVPHIGTALESTAHTAGWLRSRPEFIGMLR